MAREKIKRTFSGEYSLGFAMLEFLSSFSQPLESFLIIPAPGIEYLHVDNGNTSAKRVLIDQHYQMISWPDNRADFARAVFMASSSASDFITKRVCHPSATTWIQCAWSYNICKKFPVALPYYKQETILI